ncbi:uncharacterized protein LOC132895240 isoform X1 [Neoarius graeffei]|uniref:uncharacterized protein LOC132895240 isoform X1 n=1 Tax=Neoarius graeffei TaxID=443677 RepID=UPI00298D43D9|nr:uncharacterized protein LOC132895240 isoform X1 [Neoarius graeffei]
MYWSKHYCAVQVHFTHCPNSCINAHCSVLKHVIRSLVSEDSEVGCCQHDFFDIINSISHVSLPRLRATHWKDVGKWVRKCAVDGNEWSQTEDPSVLFCQRLGVYKQSHAMCVYVKRSVILATDDQGPGDLGHTGLFVSVSTGITPAEVHPKLAGVPNSVWAKGKHDVGLIKNAEPVVITPKSDFSPKQTQYPLKPEAIAGIKLVFDSLLKADVIVPCQDSPVRTPIFPVKKARKPSQPDEWRFVQDLQAVNAAAVPHMPDSLKSALQTTPTLGLPDPNKPFVQTVDEKKGFMTSVLLQKHGDRLRPVAYFSSRVDPVAAGLPVCLRAVAAAEKAVTASRNIVGYSNLTLWSHMLSPCFCWRKRRHICQHRDG